ncbi:MAG: hypothetical protein ACOCZK_07340 [Planctomycetota bacterium]
MIRTADIRDYLALKRAIAAEVFAPDSAFQPSRRELSEGLARDIEVNDEQWSYSAGQRGYVFTNPRRRFSVVISEDRAANDYFTSDELARYLQCYTTTENITDLLVDNWCAMACRDGLLERRGPTQVAYRLAR